MAFSVGYTNASWTLKSDLTCEYVCRLLNDMDEAAVASARPSTATHACSERPFIDFSSGYVLRSIENFPKQGSKAPWRLHQNYPIDILNLRFGSVKDEAMEFSNRPADRVAGAGRCCLTLSALVVTALESARGR